MRLWASGGRTALTRCSPSGSAEANGRHPRAHYRLQIHTFPLSTETGSGPVSGMDLGFFLLFLQYSDSVNPPSNGGGMGHGAVGRKRPYFELGVLWTTHQSWNRCSAPSHPRSLTARGERSQSLSPNPSSGVLTRMIVQAVRALGSPRGVTSRLVRRRLPCR